MFLVFLQYLLHATAVVTAVHTQNRRAVGKCPQHGLCYEWGEFNDARWPLMSSQATVVWSQGTLPTPPWGGWGAASSDALQPGLTIPQHTAFAVLNGKFLSLFDSRRDAVACNCPAAAIPVDHIMSGRLKHNLGYLTAQHRLRRPPIVGHPWCVEVVTSHGDRTSSPHKTPKQHASAGNHSSTEDGPVDIEKVPLCFPEEKLQQQWSRAIQALGHVGKRRALTKLSKSMTNLLLLPELNINPRVPFFPLPSHTICAEDGFLCLQAAPPTKSTDPSLPAHGHPSSAPMRYSSGHPVTAVPSQRWTVTSVDDDGSATICLHKDSRQAMHINDEMCLGMDSVVVQEREGPLPPVQFRACHLDAGAETSRSCFPIDDLELGEEGVSEGGVKASAPCQEACDKEPDRCKAWTFHRAGTWNANVASCCVFYGQEGSDFRCTDDASCCVSGTPKTKVGKFKQRVNIEKLKYGTTKNAGGLVLAPLNELRRRGLWRIVQVSAGGPRRSRAKAPKSFAIQLASVPNLCLTTTNTPHGKKPQPGQQPLWLARCGSGLKIKKGKSKENALQQIWFMEGFVVELEEEE